MFAQGPPGRFIWACLLDTQIVTQIVTDMSYNYHIWIEVTIASLPVSFLVEF